VYSTQLLDHFEHPRNAGVLDRAHATAQLENPACGDILKLTASFENGTITEIRFQAKGCVPSIACASALTELVQGKSPVEASTLTRDDILLAVGGVPPASGHAAQLAIDALRSLLLRLEAP
jgi:nitrogen fixation protein NifU and related proteins